MYFLAEGQMFTAEEPRYQQFEDRSQYLNAIEIETAGNVPGLEAQVRVPSRRSMRISRDHFKSFAEQVKATLRTGHDRQVDVVLRCAGSWS